jgi:hypothetical protein
MGCMLHVIVISLKIISKIIKNKQQNNLFNKEILVSIISFYDTK